MPGAPILVTGAAGSLGNVGRLVVEILLKQGCVVRAMVRKEDDRAKHLRKLGADVVVGDLTCPEDVLKALTGCRRAFLCLSVSPIYLEATMIMAAAAKKIPDFEVLVNISQLTLSGLDITSNFSTRFSNQHKQHYLAEQALNWSGLPIVHVRPTIYMNHPLFTAWAITSIKKEGILKLPFDRNSKVSPIATEDVALVIATILLNPQQHIGYAYQLTGPDSLTGDQLAQEYSKGLKTNVRFVPTDVNAFKKEWSTQGFPPHLYEHLVVMAKLQAENHYSGLTEGVVNIANQKPLTFAEFIAKHQDDIFQQQL